MLSQRSRDIKAQKHEIRGERPSEAGTLTKQKLSQRSREAATVSAVEMYLISDINATLSSGASKSPKPGISRKKGRLPDNPGTAKGCSREAGTVKDKSTQ